MSEAKTDLNQLVIFAKVVDTHSFTAAGRALGLPKSTVSRKIAQLEQRLGVQLLRRTTRKLSLTEVGAAFYERCARISTEIYEAERAIARMHDVPHGLLRVAVPHELGPALLSEQLVDFLALNEEIDVELSSSMRAVKLNEEGYDLSLHFGEPRAEEVSRDTLGTVVGTLHTRLIAGADYLDRRGVPSTPEELAEHDLVVLGSSGRDAALKLEGPEGASWTLDKRPRLLVNSLAIQRDAIASGVGIGLLPTFACTSQLQRGSMKVVLPEWGTADIDIHARYPTSHHLSAKVRAMITFLSERFAPTPWVAHTATSTTIHEGPQTLAQGAI